MFYDNGLFQKQYNRIVLRDLQASVSIGIYDHEKIKPQPIYVDVDLWSLKNIQPVSMGHFIDYDFIRDLVCYQWPLRDHVELLETLAQEVIDLALKDDRIDAVKVRVAKSSLDKTGRAGVEFFRTR